MNRKKPKSPFTEANPARNFDGILMRAVLTFLMLYGSLRAEEKVSKFVRTRFATSEHITAPTGISVSPEGVAFVSCDPNGMTNHRQKVGKVVRCEDTDGDGVADKFSDFVSNIDSPRGSCYVDDVLYLMQPPFLVAYQDPNGDGVAEWKRILITKLGQPLQATPAHHCANGVSMGIDGWLYLTIGDRGCHEATGSDGSKVKLYGGGVLRVRPDGSQLSILVTGTRNLYAIAVDPYLDLFSRDNTNDGGGWNTRLHHLTELADFGYPHLYRNFSHEHRQSLADYGTGAGTGMLYLHEPGLPEDFGDALYSGDFNTGVAIHPRERFGESYLIQQRPFMDLPKNTGIAVDGFSRMHFTSWAGGGFGSSGKPFGHVDRIEASVRNEVSAYPDINKATDAELPTHLASRSQVRRLHAMREMVSRGSKPVFSEDLFLIAKDTHTPLYARVAALMTLKQLDGTGSHDALELLYADSEMREFVVRALGDVAAEIDRDGKGIFLRALADENPRVQMHAIIALARSGDVSLAAAILPLAKEEKMLSSSKRALSHIALKAVVKLNAVDLLLSKLDDIELQEPALRGLQQIHSSKVVSGLIAKLEATHNQQLINGIILSLFRLYHREAPWDGNSWWGNRPNFKGPYYRCATWEQTPAVRKAIRTGFRKVHPRDYAQLFRHMRLNQVPEDDLDLEIDFDEVLSFLERETLTSTEFTRLMNAVADKKRPENELIQIYEYFKRGPLPESYFNRAHILRVWGESKAAGERQRQAYETFVSGKEFIGKLEELKPFFKSSEKDSNKYAHLQLLHLINDKSTPEETRQAAVAELEKTWEDKKNLYPHRLRGLMLAFEEIDPTPYAEQLKPLVDHRDERTKQPAVRFLKAIANQ